MITACSCAPSRNCKNRPAPAQTTSTAISVAGTLKDRELFLMTICKSTESSDKGGTTIASDRCSKQVSRCNESRYRIEYIEAWMITWIWKEVTGRTEVSTQIVLVSNPSSPPSTIASKMEQEICFMMQVARLQWTLQSLYLVLQVYSRRKRSSNYTIWASRLDLANTG